MILGVLLGIAIAALMFSFVYNFVVIGATIAYYVALVLVGLASIMIIGGLAALVFGSSFFGHRN